MDIRILHTGDNHIGLSFRQFPDEVRDRLVEERFAALERLVGVANERQAHFITIGGDLFDKGSVSAADIKRTVQILKGFEGEAVLVLAGNHDFCEGADSKLWKTFRKSAEGTDVLPLTEQRTHDFIVDDQPVRFYACPCPSKHGEEHRIHWVTNEDKEAGVLHLGLAHGNVEGLGLDTDHRYFNMTEDDLRAAGLHAWLLGHIHVPAPPLGTTRPPYFMPGIHTPDSVKCGHSGHAWWIEMDAQGDCDYELLSTGAVRFVRLGRTLEHGDDIDALRTTCGDLDAPHTVLYLRLMGRLKEDAVETLNALVVELRGRFLHVDEERDIAEVLEPEAVAKRFPDGTLPNALLLSLLADESHPGDAHLALNLIESLDQR